MSFDMDKIRYEAELEALKADTLTEYKNKYLLASMEKFNRVNRINQSPPQKYIKDKGNYKTLPISYVEAKLRKVFLGKVKTHSFFTDVIGNEVVGSLVLEVFHPVLQEWLTYVGAAAKQITQKKNKDRTPSPLDQWQVYKFANGLEKTYPAVRAMCLKNAAKQIGKCFGSDISRNEEDVSEETQSTQVMTKASQVQVYEAIKEAFTDVDKINAIPNDLPYINKMNNCMAMVKIARALAQCTSNKQMEDLVKSKGWDDKFKNIVDIYR